MRIGINGRFLLARQTGVQRVAYNLVDAILKLDRENQYFVFTSSDDLAHHNWRYDNVTIVRSKLRQGSLIRNIIWEQVTLPRLAKRYNIDILHSPANMAPIFYRGLSIVHVHDLCFLVNPKWYSLVFRTWYRLVIPYVMRAATKVITNSNNSRNDILQYYDIPPNKVSLIYWAVDELFQRALVDPKPDVDDYILCVGSLEPRKNINNLVLAFLRVRALNPKLRTRLVLIGATSRLFAESGLDFSGLEDDILVKGFVSDLQLRSYYRHARAVVYPSLYEGFGLPPLEAMACGAPVITSDTSSLPEVVGNAAVLVDPHNPNEIASAIDRVLKNPEFSAELVRRGTERVKEFNWGNVARRVVSLYFELHASRKGERVRISFEHWQRLRAASDQVCV